VADGKQVPFETTDLTGNTFRAGQRSECRSSSRKANPEGCANACSSSPVLVNQTAEEITSVHRAFDPSRRRSARPVCPVHGGSVQGTGKTVNVAVIGKHLRGAVVWCWHRWPA
jgi:hypothetical protein